MQLIALKQWDHSLDKNIESIVGNLVKFNIYFYGLEKKMNTFIAKLSYSNIIGLLSFIIIVMLCLGELKTF